MDIIKVKCSNCSFQEWFESIFIRRNEMICPMCHELIHLKEKSDEHSSDNVS